MSQKIDLALSRILVLFMVLTGDFPTWAGVIIIPLLVVQLIGFSINLYNKFKSKLQNNANR